MRISTRGLCIAFIAIFSVTLSTAQQVFRTTPTSVIGFLEYLPADYHNNSNKYPIVIFLHGIGERGSESTDPAVLETSIQPVTNLGPPKHVKNGTQFPFILISPQLKKNYGTWPSWYVLEVLNYVKTYLRVDERRIHVTGLSLGGGGAWVAIQDHPKLFATASPVCGGYNSPSMACGIAAENMPVWAFHGDKDTIVPISKSVNMVNAINACTPAPSPAAKMTTYVGVAHDAWERAYQPDHTWHNPNVYDWIMSYTNTTTAGNAIPVANAGADKTASAAGSISFTGSAYDKEGSAITYRWSKLSGPPATLSGTASATLTASALQAGTYVFSLKVTDAAGLTDTDYVKLTVNSGSLPVANAGQDRVIHLPTSSVALSGSGTTADGTITSYQWSRISGPAATLSNANTATLTASGLTSGTYYFRLAVADSKGQTDIDDVIVVVNRPPSPNAGADQLLHLPSSTVTLTGSGTDTDGTVAAYKWAKISGPSVTIANPNVASISVSGLQAGKYYFRLTVTDNFGGTSIDDAIVTVNNPPLVSAGADQYITLPSNAVSLTGTASDSDGTITGYDWKLVSGSTATLAGTTSPTLNVSGMTAGTYTFRFTAKDDRNATSSNDVVVVVRSSTSSSVTTNASPVANAGADQVITLPTSGLSITGIGSDADGSIASYSWMKLLGNAVSMAGTSGATLTLSGMTAGTYLFRLTVTDNSGAQSIDDVRVIVNQPPDVYVGRDVTLVLPANSATVAAQTSDPDGSIVTYQWKKLRGTTATLSGATSATLTVTNMVEGSYIFRLYVTDNAGATRFDDVTINVQSSTSASSFSEAVVMAESNDAAQTTASAMIVYDESGRKIYEGAWSNEALERLPSNHMYILHAYTADGVKKEKIFKQ